jgi:hypothetical protein
MKEVKTFEELNEELERLSQQEIRYILEHLKERKKIFKKQMGLSRKHSELNPDKRMMKLSQVYHKEKKHETI